MVITDGKVAGPNHQRQRRPPWRRRLGRRVRHAHDVGDGGRPVATATTTVTPPTTTVTTVTAVPRCRRGRRLVTAERRRLVDVTAATTPSAGRRLVRCGGGRGHRERGRRVRRGVRGALR